MLKFRVISCNVRGLLDKQKRKQVLIYNRMNKADVIFMQETHVTKGLERGIKMEWGGPMFFANGSNKSRGVIIALAKDFDAKVRFTYSDPDSRALIVVIEIENKRITLVNVYAPNEDDSNFFAGLFQKIQVDIRADEIIIGGDHLDSKLDKKGEDQTYLRQQL